MRVLVVEDEPDLQRVLERTLREEGICADVVGDGEIGLLKAQQVDYDVILLDLMLPKMDGWTVLERLRAAEKKTPVLVLTARDAVADRVRGLNSGADDYLTKPFDLKELLARLRALVRRSVGAAHSVIRVGDVEIDTASRTVRKGDDSVTLAAKEYALLELLMLNRGKLITRSVIYEHIYDDQDDSLSNVVDVYVSNLRKKLGADLIETRRGQGYIIRA